MVTTNTNLRTVKSNLKFCRKKLFGYYFLWMIFLSYITIFCENNVNWNFLKWIILNHMNHMNLNLLSFLAKGQRKSQNLCKFKLLIFANNSINIFSVKNPKTKRLLSIFIVQRKLQFNTLKKDKKTIFFPPFFSLHCN